MKKILFSAMLLLGIAAMPVNAFASENDYYNVVNLSEDGVYTGTLQTLMGGKTSTIDDFKLEYLDGELFIESFQLGSMPGTIEVSASGLVLGETKRCTGAVTLTLPIGGATSYDANVTVSEVGGKLHVEIDVLNPIYDNLPFIAEVEFTQN